MNIDANVQRIIFALMRRWKLLIIFAIIGGMIGYFYTARFTTLTYTSNVEFLAYAVDSEQEINDSANSGGPSDNNRISNTSKMNYAMKMLDTYIEVFGTNEFCNKVADDLNERLNTSYSSGTIKGSMKVESVENTAMFKVSITTADPELSYQIAHQLETTIPKVMKKTNNGLVGASVQDKALKAGSAGSLGYPKKVAIGAVIGIIIAAAYVILRNLLDIRIKTEEELIDKYNIPVLGSIPNFETKSTKPAPAKTADAKKGAE